jgi:pimeloyl-ACP methyl ester carboxylesterase
MAGIAVASLTSMTVLTPALPTQAAPVRERPPSARHLKLGRVSLLRCTRHPVAYCGHIRVPLDYASPRSPRIAIGFRWVPATGHATGTVLAVEGGPGYSSIGTQPQYLAMLGRLRGSRNLLMVNVRGTGDSTPVNCPGLEHFAGIGQYGRRFDHLVAQCGRQLNHTWRYPDGRWVHASDLFNTAYSARDVATVLRHLRVGRVDLNGDSYGSWFSQVFASRYPGLLRSVTLDSTYQVLGLRPWYTTTVITARRAFDAACARWQACTSAAHHAGSRFRSGWAVISALARYLSHHLVKGPTTTDNGTSGELTVNELTLVNLVNNAGFDPVVYRDLDAAALALLRDHDKAPLLRIAALSLGFDDTNYPLDEFSDGLYYAIGCTDYVQLFSRIAPPATRLLRYRAALRREPAKTFAPFTVPEWTNLDQYTEAYSACLGWPTPTRLVPPINRRPPLVPARLPVLIMSGDLDSLTPRLGGAALVARQLGPSARLVVFSNLTHVMLQDANDGCPASIFQRFIAHPGGLAHENVSCASRVTPVHSVGSYPLRLRAAAPALPEPGNTAGRQALRAVTVALAAVGDEISRYEELNGDRDRGLRGGAVTFAFAPGNVLGITLRGLRWVADAVVDGRARWRIGSGSVVARLSVHPDHGAVIWLTARWHVFAGPGQLAAITGRQGSARIVAAAPAP